MAGQDSSVYTETEIIFIPSDSVAGRENIKTIASISVHYYKLKATAQSHVSSKDHPAGQNEVIYYVHIYSWHLATQNRLI
jgi:hypothetical protein